MKFTGTSKWIGPDNESLGDIPVCFIRPNVNNPNEIVFEVESDNYKYDVTLRVHGEVLSGKWQLKGPDYDTGNVTGVMSRHGEDVRLSGMWFEEGISFKYAIDLQPDE